MRLAIVMLISGGLLTGCFRDNDSYERVDPETGIPILPVDPTDPEKGTTSKTEHKLSPALSEVQDCQQVADIFRAQAIAETAERVQASFEDAWQQHDWCLNDPWGWGGGGYADACASADAGASYMPSPEEGGEEEPDGHSETNNQVVGVDEADFVKTDGKYIYILSGGSFRIIKSWPAAETTELFKLALDGTPKKLFVHEDRALIYASVGAAGYDPYDPYGYGGYGSGECTYGYDCVPTGDGLDTRITVLDIADRASPQVIRQLDVSSSLLAARRIGDAVHTVVTRAIQPFGYMPSWPDDLDICTSTKHEIYLAFKKVLQQNIQTIMSAELTDIFPVVEDKVFSGSQTVKNASPMMDCSDFYKASINDGQHLTSVLSLKINDTAPASAVTILSKPGVVYASKESLYLAVPRVRTDFWGWYEDLDDSQEATTIHKFVLGHDPAGSSYVASGLVKGSLLNQFSLDEHEGYMRIASTTGRVGWGGQVHNTLTVLQHQGSALLPVGVLDNLAPTEDIRSVRFDGERGYVVTFKKTDPLFVLDLSQPVLPTVLGELKIPGFSTYMHRMDDNHLLTIGYDADDQGSFAWFTGVMLQIFDVTNPTSPQLKHKHVIGTRGSSSEALTNHLAFTYYAPKDLLAVPMTVCEDSYGGGSYGMNMTFSGLMVFDVTAAAGFALKGKVSHPMSTYASCSNWWTQASSQVKRSIIIDNFVYSISETLMKVNDLSDLQNDLVVLSLQ